MRAPPGLGNILEALTSAAALAIATRRILVIEGWPTASSSFGAPLSELLVGRTDVPLLLNPLPSPSDSATSLGTWHARLMRAQPPGSRRFDTFASHDGLSAASVICGKSGNSPVSRREPQARVWRIYSNEYFLPLLRDHPEAIARPEVRFLSADGPGVWAALVHGLLKPVPAIQQRVEDFYARHMLRSEAHPTRPPTMGFHLRCVNLNGHCSARILTQATRCAYHRLRSLENATRQPGQPAGMRAQLFIATMSSHAREYMRDILSTHHG